MEGNTQAIEEWFVSNKIRISVGDDCYSENPATIKLSALHTAEDGAVQ